MTELIRQGKCGRWLADIQADWRSRTVVSYNLCLHTREKQSHQTKKRNSRFHFYSVRFLPTR